MEFIIYFVGLIMIAKADDIGGTAGAYHALVPEWKQNEKVCEMVVPKHAVYLRVLTDDVVPTATSWPTSEVTPCATTSLKCSLYEIPSAGSLAVNPGFTLSGVKTESSFCALPRLHPAASAGKKPELDTGSKNRTILDVPIAGGSLGVFAFSNGNIFTTWHGVPPAGSTNKRIMLTVTERSGTTVRKLVLEPKKAPAQIVLMNMPPTFAGVALNTPNPSADHHQVLFQKILKPTTGDCDHTHPAKGTCLPKVKPGVTLNLSCSNTGCCRP